MPEFRRRHLTVLAAAATTVFGCLSHPATRAGDAHFDDGNYALAAAAYRHGLQEGIDSNSERERVEKQISAIEQAMVDEYIQAQLSDAREGDVEAALRISEHDGWGNEEARRESDMLLLGHLERALGSAPSALNAAQIVRVASVPTIEDDARAMGRTSLESAMQAVSGEDGIEAVRALGQLAKHPAWRIPKLADHLEPEFLKTGDGILSRLDPSADFEVFEFVRKQRGFGHRPWDVRAAEVMAQRVRAAKTRAGTQAQNGNVLEARQTLMDVARELPLTAEQHADVVAEWRRLAVRRGQELLRQARAESNAPAAGYVYAALANYFGTPGAEAEKRRFGQRVLGQPLDLLAVRVESTINQRGDCKINFEPEPVVVGAENRKQQVARVVVDLNCGMSMDVSATYSTKGGSTSEYVTTETTESEFEYCKRVSLTDSQRASCLRSMDSMTAYEREEQLTTRKTERVVTDAWTTFAVQLTGNVEVETRWSIQLEFDGKRVTISESGRTTKTPISATQSTRERFNSQSRRVEYSPPQVFFSLPFGSHAVWDPRTKQLTDSVVGTGTYVAPPGLRLDYSGAIQRLEEQVGAENRRRKSSALKIANERLERARLADDKDAVLGALLRISMLRSSNPVQAAVLDELSADEQALFEFTDEPLAVVRAGIAGEVANLGELESIALAESSWEEPKTTATGRPEQVTRDSIVELSMNDVEHDVRPWRSTGLNQNIDLGPVASGEGSSIVELSTYAQAMPLRDAEIASVVAGRLTMGGTSLEAGFAIQPFELTEVGGFDVALRHTLRFEGSSSDPKPVPYFGLAYRQMQAESDAAAAAPESTGYRFLGAEAGLALPFGQWLSLDVGSELNALWAIDLFDDQTTGEYRAMSPVHGGFTAYISRFYLHARGIYWLNAADALTPVGWRFQAGARF